MKRLTLLLALALITLGSQAQTTPEARAKAMTSTMVSHLRLNAAQAAKVKEINLTSIQQLEAAKKENKADPRKLKGIMDRISSTRLEALRGVLSPTQFQQYQQQRERKMGIPSQAGPGGIPGEQYSH